MTSIAKEEHIANSKCLQCGGTGVIRCKRNLCDGSSDTEYMHCELCFGHPPLNCSIHCPVKRKINDMFWDDVFDDPMWDK